tara:strand:+ start:444 stop:647 length:204 start_codon:yes stop_codon:yes gene_type:complete
LSTENSDIIFTPDGVGHKDSEMVKLYRHLRADDGHRHMQHMQRLNFGTVPEQPTPTMDETIHEITLV